MGACWSISERLGREGLASWIVHYGVPFIAIGILVFLLIALNTLGFPVILVIPIVTGILIGMIFFITMFLFMRSDKLKKRIEPKAWELKDQLKELEEQLGSGVISQEEYEQKKKKLQEKLRATTYI